MTKLRLPRYFIIRPATPGNAGATRNRLASAPVRALRAGLAAGLAAWLGACASTPPIAVDQAEIQREVAVQKRLALEDQVAERDRLQAIAFRLTRAAAPFCAKRIAVNYGLTVATDASFGRDRTRAASAAFGLDDRARVLSVIPGSPAGRAGLLRGDVVAAVNGVAIPPGKDADKTVTRALEAAAARGVTLRIAGANPRRVAMAPVRVCNSPVRVVDKSNVNAYADGKSISVTKGMLWFARDETELAMVLAHELAHNVMGHAGSLSGAFSDKKGLEADADYVGLYILARAGYDIDRAPQFWRRLAAAFPRLIESAKNHPIMPYRVVALRKTTAEIRARQAAGLPLIPRRLVGGVAVSAKRGAGQPET